MPGKVTAKETMRPAEALARSTLDGKIMLTTFGDNVRELV